MQLPKPLIGFLTRINRNGPIAWGTFFALNGIWFVPLVIDVRNFDQRSLPNVMLLFMFLGGLSGLLIKGLLVRSRQFEFTESSPDTQNNPR